MMDRQKREEVKKKGKRFFIIAYSLGAWSIAFIVCLFATPLKDVFRTDEGSIVAPILLLMIVILPLFASLIISSFGTMEINKLHIYKRHLYKEKNKFHTKLFWEAIQKKDFEEAKRLYNLDYFITGSMRILSNGIIMGIATQVPIDNDWSKGVYERMDSYLK